MTTRKYYYTFDKTRDAYAIYLSPFGFLKVSIVLFIIVILVFYRKQLYNLFVYKNRKFTKDNKLIDFTKHFCPNFNNAYAINYSKEYNLLDREEIQSELAVTKYEHLVSKEIVIEKVSIMVIPSLPTRQNGKRF